MARLVTAWQNVMKGEGLATSKHYSKENIINITEEFWLQSGHLTTTEIKKLLKYQYTHCLLSSHLAVTSEPPGLSEPAVTQLTTFFPPICWTHQSIPKLQPDTDPQRSDPLLGSQMFHHSWTPGQNDPTDDQGLWQTRFFQFQQDLSKHI